MSEFKYYPDQETDTMTDKLDVLVRALNGCAQVHIALLYSILTPHEYGYDIGKKYARVWHGEPHTDPNGETRYYGKSVAFFVDLATGDVWKAAGWKGPARNFVRGNITTPEGRAALTIGRMKPSGYMPYGF